MRQNRQNEKERGGMGGRRLEGVEWSGGGGIRVCDCQLWERDPLGGVKVQERRKKEQKSEKREQVSGEMEGREEKERGGECCFDVKGDGRAVVRRARGREEKK